MAISYNGLQVPESKWDMPRIISGDRNLQNGYSGSFKLAPTAVTGAAWMLKAGTSGLQCFVWDIFFSTDTTIAWTLQGSSGNANLTTSVAAQLNVNQGGTQLAVFSHDVAAVVPTRPIIDQGIAQAGTRTPILNKGWLLAQDTGMILILFTAAVAANCIATFQWTELTA